MDSGLKKRLIGALVLIVLAIIFVPMLLPSHSGSGTTDLKIPPEPSGEMQTRVLQVGPGSASAGTGTVAASHDPDHVATVNLNAHPAPAVPLPGASSEATTSAPTASAPVASAPASAVAAAPAPKPAASAAAKPQAVVVAKTSAPASAAAPAASAQPLPGGAGAAAGALYHVNLGIYADHASANKLVANARQHGFTALAKPETFRGKPVVRVLVGPFHSRAQAEAARLKLKGFEGVSTMTIEGSAVAQTGNAPASAIPKGTPGAWAVQIGAYKDEASADKVRDRLRGQGFDGYVDTITTTAGKLWRVRAGPYVSRDVAVTTRGQIAQKLKLQGDVVTQQ